MKRIITVLVLTIGLISSAGNLFASPRKSSPCELKTDMRKLWEDHIIWTRNVIFNILDDLPGTAEEVKRLLKNQVDIGNAIKPYYGRNAGNRLTALLKEHITTAAALLVALKANDNTAFNTAYTAWVANADSIASFLAGINPVNWPYAQMRAMMHEHLEATGAEALARKSADYAADVAAFDSIHRQILAMADMLTEGIAAQFPNKFDGCPLTNPVKPTECDLRSAMRKLWEDHITWTRNVIFNIIDGLPGQTEAVNRLLQNQVDIGDAIKPYYGNAAGDHLAALLHDHITTAADVLVALKNNNTVAYRTAYRAWVVNADSIAAFLNYLNPANWRPGEMKSMMHRHLARTAAEANARKNGNYKTDVKAFDKVHNQILKMADMLTDGILHQFPDSFNVCDSHNNRHRPQVVRNIPITQAPAIVKPIAVDAATSSLYQNTPNPFNNRTEISYFVPSNAKKAELLIYDDMGRLSRIIVIAERGEGRRSVIFNEPRKGVYYYRLIVDDKLIDSRKMMKF